MGAIRTGGDPFDALGDSNRRAIVELLVDGGRSVREIADALPISRPAVSRHLRLLKNAVAWACNEPQPVEVDGRGVLDVTVWRQRDSMTVHLVNLTNPMMMKGPLRETVPVGPLTARVRLPEAQRPSKVQLLTAGTTVPSEVANGKL